MFQIELRFKVADREVSLNKFASLFLADVLQSAQDEVCSKLTRIPTSDPLGPKIVRSEPDDT